MASWIRIARIVSVAAAAVGIVTAVCVPMSNSRFVYTYSIGMHRWVALTLTIMLGYILVGEGEAAGLEQSSLLPILVAVAAGLLFAPVDLRIKLKDE